MHAARTKVVSLPVGQGMGYVLECYGDSGQLVFLGLFDFGSRSDNASRGNIAASLKYLQDKMKMRMNVVGMNNGHFLDLFVVSHQDGDHWNMFNNMMSVNQNISYKEIEGDTSSYHEINRVAGDTNVVIKKKQWKWNGSSEIRQSNWDYRPGTSRLKSLRSIKSNAPEQLTIVDIVCFEVSSGEFSEGDFTNLIAECLDLSPLVRLMENQSWLELKIEKITIKGVFSMVGDKMMVEQEIITYSDNKENSVEKYKGIVLQSGWHPVKHESNNVSFIKISPFFGTLVELVDEDTQQQLIDMKTYIAVQTASVEDNSYIVRNIYLGGDPDSWELGSRMAFEAFSFLAIDCARLSGYGENSKINTAMRLDNVEFYLLVCLKGSSLPHYVEENIFASTGTRLDDLDIMKNASSAVILVLIDNCQALIFPGDMTVHTTIFLLEHVVEIASNEPDEINTFYTMLDKTAETKFLCVPHHGASRTMEGGQQEGEANTLAAFEQLLLTLKPFFTEASSGFNDSNNHPRTEVVQQCVEFSRFQESTEHVYYSPQCENYFQMTNKGFYTNVMDVILCTTMVCDMFDVELHECNDTCRWYPCDNCVYRRLEFDWTNVSAPVKQFCLWE